MRKRELPFGWYPETEGEILSLLDSWKAVIANSGGNPEPVAGIVPHAGWTYCGSMIASVLTSFPEEIETVIVLGGHTRSGGSLVNYSESSWEFPSGIRSRDSNLVNQVNLKLSEVYNLTDEEAVDNTVEVVQAMAASVFPEADWAAWRIPADKRAMVFGSILAEIVVDTGRKVAVIGSTDLTHYGSNFNFSPPDSRQNPAGWVEARDRKILDSLLTFDGIEALNLAENESSACSSGGAVAALAYAGAVGATLGKLLEYRSSRDVHPEESFVGYGSILWF